MPIHSLNFKRHKISCIQRCIWYWIQALSDTGWKYLSVWQVYCSGRLAVGRSRLAPATGTPVGHHRQRLRRTDSRRHILFTAHRRNSVDADKLFYRGSEPRPTTLAFAWWARFLCSNKIVLATGSGATCEHRWIPKKLFSRSLLWYLWKLACWDVRLTEGYAVNLNIVYVFVVLFL